MSAVPFDTLELADRLQAGGFTPEQAKTAATALAEAMQAELVTKADPAVALAELKADLLRWIATLMIGQAAIVAALVKLR
jgi:predicted RNA-binding protein associated with RNAse of E/G family